MTSWRATMRKFCEITNFDVLHELVEIDVRSFRYERLGASFLNPAAQLGFLSVVWSVR